MMKNNMQYIKEIYQKKNKIENQKNHYDFYNKTFKTNKLIPIKMVATFILTIGITVGIGYASVITYQKIWKEPQEYRVNIKSKEGYYIVEKTQEDIEEELKNCISKEQAIQKAQEVLKRFNMDEKADIANILIDSTGADKTWNIYAGAVSITVDAQTGEFRSLSIPTTGRNIKGRSTKEEALQVANDILYKYQKDAQNYEIVKLNNNMGTEEDSYIWYATFEKKYDKLYNHYEFINIGWIPGTNEIYQYVIENKKYENNPEEITKDDAIRVAVQKDKEIEPDAQIKEIKADIRIEKMNSDAYVRDKYKDKYYEQKIISDDEEKIYYVTEDRVRKVWVVTLEYDDIYNKVLYYTYYIDATTGEIIGGLDSDYFKIESGIDENNYIENGELN